MSAVAASVVLRSFFFIADESNKSTPEVDQCIMQQLG